MDIIYALFVFLLITAIKEINSIQSGDALVINKCVFVGKTPAYIVVSKPGTGSKDYFVDIGLLTTLAVT